MHSNNDEEIDDRMNSLTSAGCSESTSKESTPQASMITPTTPDKKEATAGGSSVKAVRHTKLTNLLPNGKKTKGRVKIKMEYIGNKLRRYTTFSKRKTGIMKKAHELSTLTGTQVMLLVASETGHVYAFSTSKLKPMIASDQGKNLIQGCLSAPDENFPDLGAIKTEFTFEPPPAGSNGSGTMQLMTSSSNVRKRKMPQNVDTAETMLPTMVPSLVNNISESVIECFNPDEEDEEDDDEDEDEEAEECAEESDQDDACRSDSVPTNSVNNQSPPVLSLGGFSLNGLLSQINNQQHQLRPENEQDDLFGQSSSVQSSAKRAKRAPSQKMSPAKAIKNNNKPVQSPASNGVAEALQLQKTLKEALKAAANQRKNQKKPASNTLFSSPNGLFNNSNSLSNNPGLSSLPNNGQQQSQPFAQLSAMGILPLMLQGIAAMSSPDVTQSCSSSTSSSSSCTNPNFGTTPTHMKRSSSNNNNSMINNSCSSANPSNNNSTILYQMPQGVVYASNNNDSNSASLASTTNQSSTNPQSSNNNSAMAAAAMNLILSAANGCSSSSTSSPMSNMFNSSAEDSNSNFFQQLLSGGNMAGSNMPFGNMTFQQLFATAALSQLTSEASK
jgi:uncharacterized glyoxalase superfamily protein PhnB